MSSVYEALQRARQGAPVAAPRRPQQGVETAGEMPRSSPTLPPGPLGAELSSLLAAVRPLLDRDTGTVLQFVAASAGEGTTTIAREFARLAATAGQRNTLLIDANRRDLQTARDFGCDTRHGLVEMPWTGSNDVGPITPVPGMLLSVACLIGERGPAHTDGGTVGHLYQKLRYQFELIVVDCPPVANAEYLELAPDTADGIILVVRAEATRPAVVTHAKDQIERAGGNLLGAVLNRRTNYIPGFLYRML